MLFTPSERIRWVSFIRTGCTIAIHNWSCARQTSLNHTTTNAWRLFATFFVTSISSYFHSLIPSSCFSFHLCSYLSWILEFPFCPSGFFTAQARHSFTCHSMHFNFPKDKEGNFSLALKFMSDTSQHSPAHSFDYLVKAGKFTSLFLSWVSLLSWLSSLSLLLTSTMMIVSLLSSWSPLFLLLLFSCHSLKRQPNRFLFNDHLVICNVLLLLFLHSFLLVFLSLFLGFLLYLSAGVCFVLVTLRHESQEGYEKGRQNEEVEKKNLYPIKG